MGRQGHGGDSKIDPGELKFAVTSNEDKHECLSPLVTAAAHWRSRLCVRCSTPAKHV